MEKRIYYHDTDAGGVVYYGTYLSYLEEARTEYFENKGISIKTFHEHGVLYAVRNCNVSYKSPARYGDIIICEAKLVKTTAARMIFEQTITHKEDNRTLIEAEVTLVSLNSEFKPKPIPNKLKALMDDSAA